MNDDPTPLSPQLPGVQAEFNLYSNLKETLEHFVEVQYPKDAEPSGNIIATRVLAHAVFDTLARATDWQEFDAVYKELHIRLKAAVGAARDRDKQFKAVGEARKPSSKPRSES
jgi:hypothetical protein